jgi:hypothetical protein
MAAKVGWWHDGLVWWVMGIPWRGWDWRRWLGPTVETIYNGVSRNNIGSLGATVNTLTSVSVFYYTNPSNHSYILSL